MRTVHPRPRLRHYLKERLDAIEATHAHFIDVRHVLDSAERLVVECESLQVQGLVKLSTDVSVLTKLQSVMSELRAAIIFARQGAAVKLLRDQEFGHQFYAPDLQVAYDSLDFLVEVCQSRPATPSVSVPLDRALKESGLPFAVETWLGLELSVPRFGHEDRRLQEVRAEAVIAKLIEKLSCIPAGSSGEILVGEHCFPYEPSSFADGYAAGGVTAAHGVDSDAHEKKFRGDLARKAKKQPRLPPAWRTKPFVVAYDNQESELFPHMVLSSLTGPRNVYLMNDKPPINHPPSVTTAWSSSWQPLLQEWNYGPDAELRFINGYGAFGDTGADPWGQNLSGVLVIHAAGLIQWFPNPFASLPIRELRLLDLGLPIDQRGAYRERLPG